LTEEKEKLTKATPSTNAAVAVEDETMHTTSSATNTTAMDRQDDNVMIEEDHLAGTGGEASSSSGAVGAKDSSTAAGTRGGSTSVANITASLMRGRRGTQYNNDPQLILQDLHRMQVERDVLLKVIRKEEDNKVKIVAWMQDIGHLLNVSDITAPASTSSTSQTASTTNLMIAGTPSILGVAPLLSSAAAVQAMLSSPGNTSSSSTSTSITTTANSASTSSSSSSSSATSLSSSHSSNYLQLMTHVHRILRNRQLLPVDLVVMYQRAIAEGIEEIEDVSIVLDGFRYMSWCTLVLQVLRYPPPTPLLKRCIEAKPLKFGDDRILKHLQMILSKAR
jgi:hypothetical protein